jgi:hypothetical protein
MNENTLIFKMAEPKLTANAAKIIYSYFDGICRENKL